MALTGWWPRCSVSTTAVYRLALVSANRASMSGAPRQSSPVPGSFSGACCSWLKATRPPVASSAATAAPSEVAQEESTASTLEISVTPASGETGVPVSAEIGVKVAGGTVRGSGSGIRGRVVVSSTVAAGMPASAHAICSTPTMPVGPS